MKWMLLVALFLPSLRLPAQDRVGNGQSTDPAAQTPQTRQNPADATKAGEGSAPAANPAPAPAAPREEPRPQPFTLDLTKYAPGDLPGADLGTNLMVMEEKGEKYLRGRTDDGEISVKVSLTGIWEVSLNVQNIFSGFTFSISDGAGTDCALTLDSRGNLLLGAEKIYVQNVKAWGIRKPNKITLNADGQTIKCLINDKAFASIPQTIGKTMNRLSVRGVAQKTRVTGLKGDVR